MDNRIDMSLDKIIKKDRITAGKPGKRGSHKKTNQVWSTGQRKPKEWEVKKIGAVSRTMKTTADNSNRFAKNHSTKANQFKPTPNQFTTISSSSLLISNLHPRVSDSDIRELFSECGPLKSCSVYYDSTGRSMCKAQVVFVKLSDANRAVHKYNQVPLDGRPLNIQPLITTPLKTNIAHRLGSIAQQSFNKPKGAALKHPNARSKQTNAAKRVSGSSRANIRGKQKKTTPTIDQLNSDLDSYIQKKQT